MLFVFFLQETVEKRQLVGAAAGAAAAGMAVAVTVPAAMGVAAASIVPILPFISAMGGRQ